MNSIKKADGKKIIDFLESTLKIEMPRDGFLAGQSVCSALLYLHKKQKDFFINDLDIFQSDLSLNRKEIMSFNKKQEKMLHSMVGFEKPKLSQIGFNFMDKKISDNFKLEDEIKKEFIKKENKLILDNDEYKHDFINGISYIVKNRNTFYNQKEVSFKVGTRRAIFDTTRKGIFNYIYFNEGVYADKEYLSILNDFDINCTQIGICLRSHRIIFTKHFLDFYNTMKMSICRPNTPYHSVIRLFKKQEEFGFDCSTEFESLYIANLLRFGIFSKKNKYKRTDNRIQGYCFGDIYANKFKANNNINNYFNLYELKKQTEELKKQRKNLNQKFYDYNLYRLRSSVDNIDYISSGEHKKQLENSLGAKVKGYEDYIQANLRNIIKKDLDNNKKTYSYFDNNLKFSEKYKNINKEKNINEIDYSYMKMENEYEIFNYYTKFSDNINPSTITKINEFYYKSNYFNKLLYLTDNEEDMLDIFEYVDKMFFSDNIVRGAIINKNFSKNSYDYKSLKSSIDRTINTQKKKYSNEVLSNELNKFKFICPEGYQYKILNSEYDLKEQALYQKFVLTPYKLGIKNNKYLIVSFYKNKEDRKTLIFNIIDNELYLNSYKLYTYIGKNEKESDNFFKDFINLNNIKTL